MHAQSERESEYNGLRRATEAFHANIREFSIARGTEDIFDMSSGIRDDELLAEGASASPSRGGLDSRDTTLDRGVSSERFHYLKSLTAKIAFEAHGEYSAAGIPPEDA
jgi:hypothetical protein